jgi:hypothetical protein
VHRRDHRENCPLDIGDGFDGLISDKVTDAFSWE